MRAARPRRSFQTLLALWMGVWLLLLIFMFSGLHFLWGPVHVRTLTLDWTFVRDWWFFISRGVIITMELAVISIALATVLAFAAALARISRVPSVNSLAS